MENNPYNLCDITIDARINKPGFGYHHFFSWLYIYYCNCDRKKPVFEWTDVRDKTKSTQNTARCELEQIMQS